MERELGAGDPSHADMDGLRVLLLRAPSDPQLDEALSLARPAALLGSFGLALIGGDLWITSPRQHPWPPGPGADLATRLRQATAQWRDGLVGSIAAWPSELAGSGWHEPEALHTTILNGPLPSPGVPPGPD